MNDRGRRAAVAPFCWLRARRKPPARSALWFEKSSGERQCNLYPAPLGQSEQLAVGGEETLPLQALGDMG